MSHRKKGVISPFVQSGNLEFFSLMGFEPGTLRVADNPLIHYTKFPYENFLKKFDLNYKNFLQFFGSRVASGIEQQSAISCEKT